MSLFTCIRNFIAFECQSDNFREKIKKFEMIKLVMPRTPRGQTVARGREGLGVSVAWASLGYVNLASVRVCLGRL